MWSSFLAGVVSASIAFSVVHLCTQESSVPEPPVVIPEITTVGEYYQSRVTGKVFLIVDNGGILNTALNMQGYTEYVYDAELMPYKRPVRRGMERESNSINSPESNGGRDSVE